jgi:hypothetical protein
MKVARVLEVLVGVVFLVAAASKTYDMLGFAVQVRNYGIFPSDPGTEMAFAWILTTIEAVIGAALIAGIHLRGWLLAGTAALLVAFSALIAYGWAFHTLEDCGCFGTSIQLGPGASIFKNVVLLVMTGIAWFMFRGITDENARKLQMPALGAAGAALAAVFAVGLLGADADGPVTKTAGPALTAEDAKNRPFAKFVFEKDDGAKVDLGDGAYVIPILNATCEHCQEAVGTLNEVALTDGYPAIVALVYADSEEAMDEFNAIAAPQFDAFNIDMSTLFDLVIGNAPPSFYHTVDGAVKDVLDAEEPTAGQLLELATG